MNNLVSRRIGLSKLTLLSFLAPGGFFPGKKCFISKYGRNTLTVYIAQAFLYKHFDKILSLFPSLSKPGAYCFAFGCAMICVAVTGSNFIADAFRRLLAGFQSSLTVKEPS